MHPDTEPGSYVRLKVSDTGTGHGQGDRRSGPSSRSSPPRGRAKAPASGLPPSTASSPARAGGSTSTPSPAWARRSRSTCPASSAGRRSEGKPGRAAGAGTRRGHPRRRGRARRAADGGAHPHQGRLLGDRRRRRRGGARRSAREASQPIDLLLTDVIMPGMLGTELVERIKELRPELARHLHVRLQPRGAGARRRWPSTDGNAFIEKPFNAGELLQAVRDLLDAGAPGSRGDRPGSMTARSDAGNVWTASIGERRAQARSHPGHRRSARDPAPDRAHPRRALRVRVRRQRRGGAREAGRGRVRPRPLRHPDAGRVGPGPGRGDRSRATPTRRSSWSPASTTPRSPSRPSRWAPTATWSSRSGPGSC